MKNIFVQIKNGFTLAEVLITLVIVGVIAALTIPNIVQHYKKQEVVSKLKKFYSNMQQAINMYLYSESMNAEQMSFPEDSVLNYTKTLEFWDNSIGKYFVTVKKENSNGGNTYPRIYLADGSTFILKTQRTDTMHIFYCTNSSCPAEHFDGKTSFLFTITQGKIYTSSSPGQYSRSYCLNDCKKDGVQRHYCSRLIQIDGWQIKDDYPWF